MNEHRVFAIAQLNPTVGDIAGNTAKLIEARAIAAAQEADVVIAPEMYLSGYQIDDLVLTHGFLEKIAEAIEDLAALTLDGGPAIMVGAPRRDGAVIRNSVFVLDAGSLAAVRDKIKLPISGVFDDPRNFTPAERQKLVEIRGVRVGVLICEDLWHIDVVKDLADDGAEILICVNGSPFEIEKADQRMNVSVDATRQTNLPLIYINLVGGQDDLVFDGASYAMNPPGTLAAHLPNFSESVAMIEVTKGDKGLALTGPIHKPDEGLAAIWRCVTTGIRDYTEKNGFDKVLLGLSGGIDSALIAVMASDALGPGRVEAVMMPSPFTAEESLEDAASLAANLGIRLDTLSIETAMDDLDRTLKDVFLRGNPDIAQENLQSRLRGVLLMAISNTCGHLLLTTGNKSEYATGYATLYGDMCGGYAPLIDIWKTTVFNLASWRNETLPKGSLGQSTNVIPERIITRPPSAELRADQKDTDSLPEYHTLDPIVKGLVEDMESPIELIAKGYDREVVSRLARLLRLAEYKRRQAAPGPKTSKRSFYRDRRFPITSQYNAVGD